MKNETDFENKFERWPLNHGSFFSGIGGFDLAAQWMGWNNIFQVEKDEWCQRVLKKNFSKTKRYGDIKEFTGHQYAGTIDVLSGGFPCQPFSKAGRMQGIEDDRYLWPEMLRGIQEIRPEYVIGENVTNIEHMALDMVLTSLEDAGFKTETYIIPASAIGAWHRRERIWIIAHNSSNRRSNNQFAKGCNPDQICSPKSKISKPTNIDGKSLEGHARYEYSRERWEVETGRNGEDYWPFTWAEVASGFCRDNDGVPNRMDRIRGLGNAIVPQVAYEIFRAVEEIYFQNDYQQEPSYETQK